MTTHNIILLLLLLEISKEIIKNLLNFFIGIPKKELANKLTKEYILSIIDYFSERDKRIKIEKAIKTLELQRRFALASIWKTLIIGIYIYLFIKFLFIIFGRSTILTLPFIGGVRLTGAFIFIFLLRFTIKKVYNLISIGVHK